MQSNTLSALKLQLDSELTLARQHLCCSPRYRAIRIALYLDLRRLDNKVQEALDELRVRKAIQAGEMAVASAFEYISNGDIQNARAARIRASYEFARGGVWEEKRKCLVQLEIDIEAADAKTALIGTPLRRQARAVVEAVSSPEDSCGDSLFRSRPDQDQAAGAKVAAERVAVAAHCLDADDKTLSENKAFPVTTWLDDGAHSSLDKVEPGLFVRTGSPCRTSVSVEPPSLLSCQLMRTEMHSPSENLCTEEGTAETPSLLPRQLMRTERRSTAEVDEKEEEELTCTQQCEAGPERLRIKEVTADREGGMEGENLLGTILYGSLADTWQQPIVQTSPKQVILTSQLDSAVSRDSFMRAGNEGVEESVGQENKTFWDRGSVERVESV